jgi:hypothetical protein
VKPSPRAESKHVQQIGIQYAKSAHPDGSGNGWIFWSGNVSADKTRELYPGEHGIICPYGKPGDRLWVRETWACTPVWDWQAEGLDQPTNQVCGPKHTIYKADDDAVRVRRWKPPIHMPRWASRITLEVVSVRVERLQDISTYDSLAEGVGTDVVPMAQKMYADLWESINGPGSWDANPWVWVVEFKRIHP